jgi:hypothetical protein
VLSRNLRRWPDAVIVCDLTTSMYPYSTQVFAWFRKIPSTSPCGGIVFYTDCDSLGRETVPGGPPGQMFVTGPGDVGLTLPVMLAAARNTVANAQSAENDVEALLFAQQQFPAARHLVLLADNRRPVKDLDRLGGRNPAGARGALRRAGRQYQAFLAGLLRHCPPHGGQPAHTRRRLHSGRDPAGAPGSGWASGTTVTSGTATGSRRRASATVPAGVAVVLVLIGQ